MFVVAVVATVLLLLLVVAVAPPRWKDNANAVVVTVAVLL